MNVKELLKENVGTTITKEDLQKWLKDFNEVKEQIAKWVSECTILGNATYKLDYILGRIHHNNAYSICSDTSEPLEYVDFNYGSITCTVSILHREEPELISEIEGYITRNGQECEGGCSVDIDEVKEILSEDINYGIR